MEYQYHSLVHHRKPQATIKNRKKREVRSTSLLAREIGAENNRGTNIQHIVLDRSKKRQTPQGRVPPDSTLPRELNSPGSEISLVTVLGGTAVGLLTVCLTVIAVVVCKSKGSVKGKNIPKGSGSSKPVMPPQSHQSDSSEV